MPIGQWQMTRAQPLSTAHLHNATDTDCKAAEISLTWSKGNHNAPDSSSFSVIVVGDVNGRSNEAEASVHHITAGVSWSTSAAPATVLGS